MKKLLVLYALAALSLGARAEVTNVGGDEFKALLGHGVTVVDVRTLGEWRQTGVVDGSHLLTLFDEQGRADPAAWLRQVEQLGDPARPIAFICRTGNRSGKAAQLLEQKYPGRKVYNVRDGITGWARAGQPVVSLERNRQRAGIKCSPAC